MADTPLRFLIVEARFYEDIADALAAGAIETLTEAGVEYDRIAVPGALEIPAAIAMAAQSREGAIYDGYVALGCVIRGETYHFEIVCNESARALMDLSTMELIAIGNGILTVENADQAWERADPARKNKGGDAARAALAMSALARKFGIESDD
ncbi:6,7-dimethyl-8-ribityllumazine synthase [Alphaproteobacteria bacterium LSUCC0684]